MTTKTILLLDMDNLLYSTGFSKRVVGGDKSQSMVTRIVQAFFFKFSRILSSYSTDTHQIYAIWDGDGDCWRDALCTEYKGRPKSPERIAMKAEIIGVKPVLQSLLQAYNVTQVYKDHHEGDDLFPVLIRSLAEFHESRGEPVFFEIFSNDRDMFSLISDKVCVHQPTPPVYVVTHENFEEVTGFKTPHHFSQAKWLMPDYSDNLAGIMSRQEAIKLMAECDDIDSLLADPSKVETYSDEVQSIIQLSRLYQSKPKIEHKKLITKLDGHQLSIDDVECIPPKPSWRQIVAIGKKYGVYMHRTTFDKLVTTLP